MIIFAGIVGALLLVVYVAIKAQVKIDQIKAARAATDWVRTTDEAIAAGDGSDRWGPLDELQLRRARRNLQ